MLKTSLEDMYRLLGRRLSTLDEKIDHIEKMNQDMSTNMAKTHEELRSELSDMHQRLKKLDSS